MPQVPPQLLNNPTHVIQHLAFGSIVLLSNGISHGICPHKQRVPVVRAGKRMESQVQESSSSFFHWCLSTVLGKNSFEFHQSEEFEGKKDGTISEKGQDDGNTTGARTERQRWRQLRSASQEVTAQSSAVTAGSSYLGSQKHRFLSTGFPKAQSLCKVHPFPFKLERISHFFQTNWSQRKKKVPVSFRNTGGQVAEKDPTDLKPLP